MNIIWLPAGLFSDLNFTSIIGYAIHMFFSTIILIYHGITVFYLRNDCSGKINKAKHKRTIWWDQIYGYLHITIVGSFLRERFETDGQTFIYAAAVILYVLAIMVFLVSMWKCRKLLGRQSEN